MIEHYIVGRKAEFNNMIKEKKLNSKDCLYIGTFEEAKNISEEELKKYKIVVNSIFIRDPERTILKKKIKKINSETN